MDVRIYPSVIRGCVTIPVSKSVMHRALICASFSPYPVRIAFCGDAPADVRSTIGALRALGANVRTGDGYVDICRGEAPEKAEIDCLMSASTLRFMLCGAAVRGVDTLFLRGGRLSERPVESLLSELERHGVSVSRDPLSVSGTLTSGSYSVPSDITSQYLSGLMMALPFAKGESILTPSTDISSEGYIALTEGVLRDFGITLGKDSAGGFILDGRDYAPPKEYFAEGDWSSAAFILAAGAIAGSCTVRGLREDSLQPDREIINILRKMGAPVDLRGDGSVSVVSSPLTGIEADCDGIPDLVPVIAALAANAGTPSILRGVGRLRYKESDRLEALCAGLTSMGCRCVMEEDALSIIPSETSFFTADSFADHRIAMAMAVASLRCGCVIKGAESVDKSYPGFYKDLERLGAKIG